MPKKMAKGTLAGYEAKLGKHSTPIRVFDEDGERIITLSGQMPDYTEESIRKAVLSGKVKVSRPKEEKGAAEVRRKAEDISDDKEATIQLLIAAFNA